MNIQQLEYVVAVDRHRNFGKAAATSFVTQPTLSAMIQKLEEELEVLIFDRSTQPVVPTECGKEIIEQAKEVIAEVAMLKEIALKAKGNISGNLLVGVIPTVAVYLMKVLAALSDVYPHMKLQVREMTTENIIEKLRSGDIDTGILATPLYLNDLHEEELYLEPLKVFVSTQTATSKKYILPCEIKPEKV